MKRVNKNVAWYRRFKFESAGTFLVSKMYMLIFGGFLLPGWCSDGATAALERFDGIQFRAVIGEYFTSTIMIVMTRTLQSL